MHQIDPFSIYICHNVSTQVIKSSFWASPKHHQATQTGNTVECSLLSNCLPKKN